MKKIFLILVAIIFTTSVNAHSTKNLNFDLKKECTKKKSALKWVSKNKISPLVKLTIDIDPYSFL